MLRLASSRRFFCKVHSPTPWVFYFAGFSAMSDLGSLSRAILRSWGSFRWFNVYDIFGGGSEMVCWACDHFGASWFAWSTDLIGGLRSLRRVAVFLAALVWGRSWGILVHCCSLCEGGSENVGGTASRLHAMSREVFSLTSILVVTWQRRSCGFLFPSLWWGFPLWPSFLLLCRGLEN